MNSCKNKFNLTNVKFKKTFDDNSEIIDSTADNTLTFPITLNIGHLEYDQQYYSYLKVSENITARLNFTIKIEALSCNSNEAINSYGDCVKYIELDDDEEYEGSTSSKDESIIFLFKTVRKPDHIIGGDIIYLNLDKETKVSLYGKFGSSPTPSNFDFYYDAVDIDFELPLHISLAGNWYVVFEFEDPVNYVIRSKTKHCSVTNTATKYGVNCNLTIPNVEKDGQLYINQASSDELVYYRVKSENNITKPLNISLAPFNSTIENPFEFFISYDELPYYSDISNLSVSDSYHCSLQTTECKVVYTMIFHNHNLTKYYYVGVRFKGNNKESPYFGIFKNSLCPECKFASECSKDGEARGTCVCNNGYEGIDCSITSNIWKLQLIVFIVVGCILAFTTIASIVAMIISRKKKSDGYTQF